jgi:PAS domain-containing protein
MQEENLKDVDESKKIESTIAIFRNFSPQKPVDNAVIYFWESHTKNPGDKKNTQATIDLIYKDFDIATCEKYEVRTGYLSRYNYLKKSVDQTTNAEMEEAVLRGEEEEQNWLKRCNPELPGFIQKKWQDCISKKNNCYFEECKELLIKEIKCNENFKNAFIKSAKDYSDRHGTNCTNGEFYILEEISWIYSLMLVHLNKPVYLIHVGNDNPAIKEMFGTLPNLQKSVKWLSPRLKEVVFSNTADFLMYYRNNSYAGCSYAIENKEVVKAITTFKKELDSTKEELLRTLSREVEEKNMLYSIIEKIPGHVYWLNRDNVYLGCNNLQAKEYDLKSRQDIIGKTNRDLHTPEEADILDRNNTVVMETGRPFEGDEHASFTTSRYGNYLTHKTPLFDTHGKVMGLLGISMDITDRKRAEKLAIQNEIQKKFQKVADQVVHDIRTPLQVLLNVSKSCKNLSEKEHVMLRDSVDSLKNIAQEFLEYSFDKKESFEYKHILVSQTLTEILDQKKRQYSGKKN